MQAASRMREAIEASGEERTKRKQILGWAVEIRALCLTLGLRVNFWSNRQSGASDRSQRAPCISDRTDTGMGMAQQLR